MPASASRCAAIPAERLSHSECAARETPRPNERAGEPDMSQGYPYFKTTGMADNDTSQASRDDAVIGCLAFP